MEVKEVQFIWTCGKKICFVFLGGLSRFYKTFFSTKSRNKLHGHHDRHLSEKMGR
jgi:hypothetical protein